MCLGHTESHGKRTKGRKAGLLVTLGDCTLSHGYRTAYYETRAGMPVMYVGGVHTAPKLLSAAILYIVRLALSEKFFEEASSSSEEDAQVRLEAQTEVHRRTALEFMLMVKQVSEELQRDMRAHEEAALRLTDRERGLQRWLDFQSNTVLRQFPALTEEVRAAGGPSVGRGASVYKKPQIIEWIIEQENQGIQVTQESLMKKWGLSKSEYTELGKITKLKKEARDSRA